MTKEELAEIIADYLAEHTVFDNLGDGESICFLGELPTINLVVLSELILSKCTH